MAAEAAAVAARRRQQRHLDPFRGVLRQRAADAERLVVGVREDRQQRLRHEGQIVRGLRSFLTVVGSAA